MQLPPAVASILDQGIQFVYSFQPLAEKTVVLVPDVVRDYTAMVADAIGMDIDTTTMVLGMFLCYPLGMIMVNIPFGYPRHVFSFLLGAFLLQFTLGVQWIHQLISSVVAYAMMLFLPRKTVKFALPFFAMFYMTMGHLHRQYINYLGWDMDFTSAQMVITMKLYMIAYNLYDGELLAKGKEDRAAKKCAKYALKDVPGFMEFLGYTFCFSNVLAGPVTEYAVYCKAIDGSLMYNADGTPKGKIPSQVLPSLKPLLTSLVCMVSFLVINGNFPILDTEDPQKNTPYILSEEFLKYNIIYRLAYYYIGLLGLRCKYYFGWKNAEGCQNTWYAGFDGFDEKGEPLGWETSNNMDILGFEFAPDVQMMTKNWNKKTSFWLTRYVYMRTGGNLLAVYALSAFWHGFYPGYYMFFLSVPLLTFCDRLAKKKLSPRFSSSRLSPYGLAGWFFTTTFVNYMIGPFVMLAFSWSFELYKCHYFFGHIGAVLYYIVLTQIPTPKGEKSKTA